MNRMEVTIDGGRTAFSPGDTLSGRALWSLAEAPETLEIRLFWFTRGRGTQDVGVVESLELNPAAEGDREFRFRLPSGPYSFSGKLVSVAWAVELVAEPWGASARAELVVAPGGWEVRLAGASSPDDDG